MEIFIDTPFNGWAHLVADTVENLHLFAKEIGMEASWFQDKPGRPHYDCTGVMIKNAINAGAVKVTRAKLVEYLQKNYSPEFLSS